MCPGGTEVGVMLLILYQFFQGNNYLSLVLDYLQLSLLEAVFLVYYKTRSVLIKNRFK